MSITEKHFKVQFFVPSEEERKKVFQMQRDLLDKGVSFDAGFSMRTQTRDWELDWSLRGPMKAHEIIEFIAENGLRYTVMEKKQEEEE